MFYYSKQIVFVSSLRLSKFLNIIFIKVKINLFNKNVYFICLYKRLINFKFLQCSGCGWLLKQICILEWLSLLESILNKHWGFFRYYFIQHFISSRNLSFHSSLFEKDNNIVFVYCLASENVIKTNAMRFTLWSVSLNTTSYGTLQNVLSKL